MNLYFLIKINNMKAFCILMLALLWAVSPAPAQEPAQELGESFMGIYSPSSGGIGVYSDGSLTRVPYYDSDKVSWHPLFPQGPRLQTVVVSFHLKRAWGAGPDITSGILFQTDALSLVEPEVEAIPADRLYNDLAAALAKAGITIRAGKDVLTILGWSIPNRRDIVLQTPPYQKPRQ